MTGLSDKVKFVTVDIRKGENTSAEYRKINRFGKVPFLKWGDFKLAETLSIMVFLCEAFGLSDWLPNRTREFLRERARVENVLDWLLSELLTKESGGRRLSSERSLRRCMGGCKSGRAFTGLDLP